MKTALLAILTACTTACGAAMAAGEITVYKQQRFTGDSLPLKEATLDLSRVNFHDQISSIVVHSGAWEVCTQPNFRGDCVVLRPGAYPALETRINHRIESVREAPLYALREPADEAHSGKATERVAALEVFAARGFKGRIQRVHRDVPVLLETGFDASALSLVVRDGTWQGCTEPGYQGVCRIFAPGRYQDLDAFGTRIVSLKRLDAAP